MLHELKCYFKLIGAYIRSATVHRFGFVMYIFGLMLTYVSYFLGVWVILNRFSLIEGWSLGQIGFIYILSLISYGVRNLFFIQFRQLGNMVKKGEIDQVLTKPMNSFVYIMGNRFELGGLSYILLGIFLFIILWGEIGLQFTFINVCLFVLTIISAALVQGAITVIIGTTAFFITETSGLDRLYNSLREFIWYPITLYNKFIQMILFFVIPLAFASFVPAGIFLNHPDYNVFPGWLWKLSLLSGVIFFTIAYMFWTFGLKRYQSTGS